MSPQVILGFSEPYGSWKITCIFRRMARISEPLSWVRSWPSKMMLPWVGL